MTSGKTRRLLDELGGQKACYPEKKIVIITHQFDTRDQTGFSTHDTFTDTQIVVTTIEHLQLSSLPPIEDMLEYDIVSVEEGQFFGGILRWAFSLKALGKIVYAAGLDLDANTFPFGEMHDLAMIADINIQCNAYCHDCAQNLRESGDLVSMGRNAVYSYRKIPSKEQILIGGADMYIALCKRHYMERKYEFKLDQPPSHLLSQSSNQL